MTSDDPDSGPSAQTTAARSRKAREKRRQAGEVQLIAWVPAGRTAYARQLLADVLAGRNTLPPDPDQTAAIVQLEARVTALDASLGVATADLEAAHSKANIDAGLLADAITSVAAAKAELAIERAAMVRYKPSGWRGRLIKLLAGG